MRIIINFIVAYFYFTAFTYAQFYNKDIVAEINIEQGGEFYTFKATAHNKTPTDFALKYDYSVFFKDENDNVSKSNQVNRFFIKANEKKILNKLTINYNLEKHTIILLIIYDENDKPIGKDRIVLENGGKTKLEKSVLLDRASSDDQSKPQDGYIPKGFVNHKSITKIGRDFFRLYFLEFYNKNIVTTKNILIEETPARGRSTRISVKVDNETILQFFSQPRKGFNVEMAKQAISRTLRHLRVLEQQKQQLTKY